LETRPNVYPERNGAGGRSDDQRTSNNRHWQNCRGCSSNAKHNDGSDRPRDQTFAKAWEDFIGLLLHRPLPILFSGGCADNDTPTNFGH
jgi:hypothetical protein